MKSIRKKTIVYNALKNKTHFLHIINDKISLLFFNMNNTKIITYIEHYCLDSSMQ